MKITELIRIRRPLRLSLLILLLTCKATLLGQQPDARFLAPNDKVERELTDNEGHYYGVKLDENEFLQIRVEQKGIDVFVRVLSTEFEPLASWYGVTGNQGVETLSYIAPKAGFYLIGVAMYDKKSDKGSYVINRGASRLATAKDKRRVEAERLFVEAGEISDPEIMVRKLSQSLIIWKELGDVELQKQTEELVLQIGNSKAISVLNEATELSDKNDTESRKKALSMFQVALELFKNSGDRENEGLCLGSIGGIYYKLNEDQKALEFFNLALPIFKELNSKTRQAYVLFSIGAVYDRLGEYINAIKAAQAAIPLLRELGDKEEEARTLIDIGLYYRSLGDRKKSTENFDLALPTFRDIGDKKTELKTLNRIGTNYWYLREPNHAQQYFQSALKIATEIGDKDAEAETLNNIGEIYNTLLRDYSQALKYFTLALAIRKTVLDRSEEGKILNNIGTVYFSQGNYQYALQFYDKALSIFTELGEKEKEVTVLTNMGHIHKDQGNNKKALELFIAAYEKATEAKEKEDAYTASLIREIGDIYLESQGLGKAIGYFAKALSISKFVGDKVTEADTLDSMAMGYAQSKHRRMALFFFKLYINKLQEMRGAAKGLNSESQKLFLSRINGAYKSLASIMIFDERYDLAVQVLNLYQDQQFFDLNPDPTAPIKQASLSPREQEFADIFDKSGKDLGEINSQLENLKQQTKNRPPTETEASHIKKLEGELAALSDAYYKSFNTAYQKFAEPLDDRDKIAAIKEVEDMQGILGMLQTTSQQKVAAVYTFIDSDKVHLLLITADGNVSHFESEIKADDLNEKIRQFYALLQSDMYDTTVLGKQLYDKLFRPLDAELQKAGVQTLMWQLDGSLRYIPIAALFDGKQFLAERYNNVNFTRADSQRLTRAVNPNWTGTGFGTSDAKTVDILGEQISFSALPGVKAELSEIFKQTNSKTGILTGEVLPDGKFTKTSFLEAMKQKRPLVHIASHFSFRPGDEARSFLLLGDGTAFTLNEMKAETNLFEGVDLLTLSACNTAAAQPDASGREIDGFAELAQRLGAGSVMATLWSVSDASTPWLMRDFYANRQSKPGTNKAEALRNAQLALLNGTAKTRLLPNNLKGTGPTVSIVITPDGKRDAKDATRAEIVYVAAKDAPLFKKDTKKPFSHPYYWAPFVLFGNWR